MIKVHTSCSVYMLANIILISLCCVLHSCISQALMNIFFFYCVSGTCVLNMRHQQSGKLPSLTSTELKQVVSALTYRRDVNLNAGNKRKWKCKIQNYVSETLAANYMDIQKACCLKSQVSEKCLRRLGLWHLVQQSLSGRRLPIVAARHRNETLALATSPSGSGSAQPIRNITFAALSIHQHSVLTTFADDGASALAAGDILAEEVLGRLAHPVPGGTRTVNNGVRLTSVNKVQKVMDLSRTVERIQRGVRPSLAAWSVDHGIPVSAVGDLLVVLKEYLPGLGLPKNAATLLNVSTFMVIACA